MSSALERFTSTETEPVTIYAAFTEMVRGILPVAVLFGLPLSPEQLAGLVIAVGVVATFVQVWKTRTKTVPPDALLGMVEAGVISVLPPDEPGKHAADS